MTRSRPIGTTSSNSKAKEASYYYCDGDHPPGSRTRAQSGLVDADGKRYCRPCFRRKFPDRDKDKSGEAGRKCVRCGAPVASGNRMCCKCRRKLKCANCPLVCPHEAPNVCTRCNERFALWCSRCYSEERRASQRCLQCWLSKANIKCQVCFWSVRDSYRTVLCAQSGCKRRFHVCTACVPVDVDTNRYPCLQCWKGASTPCAACGEHRGIWKPGGRRMCLSCQESWDCPKCKKRRPLGVSYPCSSCGMLRAVWCSDCYEANAIELRLCGRCVESADRCAYCHRSSSDNCSVSVVECSRHECSHVVMICDTCVHSCRHSGVSCRPCWRKEKKCIVCCDRPAQTAMGYGGRCSTCAWSYM